VATIESLSRNNTHPLQVAWIKHDVPQCGYCQSGQLMSAAALLEEQEPERRGHRRRDERQHVPLRHLPAHAAAIKDAAHPAQEPEENDHEHIAETSNRRGFLKTSSALTSWGLHAGRHAGLPVRAGRRHALHAQCLGAHRRRQHHHPDLGPVRDGAGRLHLHADADRRRTSRRPPQDPRRDRAAGHQGLPTPCWAAQITGGSTSVRDGWDKLRIAGAQVREMLVSAAAARWNVDRTLKAGNGMVTGPKGLKATFGSLAEAASNMPVPEKPWPLKDPKDFRVVGKRTRRLDTPMKVNGTAEFGIDVKLPGMVYAALEQSPGDRRQGQELRRGQGQGHARRDRRGADSRRRGGGGRQLVARQPGPQALHGAVGRRARSRP
jgi:hypothetical protein